jgi:hypothetical protein
MKENREKPGPRSESSTSYPAYFTLKALARDYARELPERLLRDALKSPENPLPCFRINAKTILVAKADFDQWIARYRSDPDRALDKIVDGVMDDL